MADPTRPISDPPRRQPRRHHPLGDKGLAIVLAVLFLASWIGQFIFELFVVRNEANAHGESFSWGDFWPSFWQSTLENWQSEFLQLLTFVVLTTYLIYRGSHESKDSDDEMHAALGRIEAQLQELRDEKRDRLAHEATTAGS
jgi:Domain of unknown function (DUF6766)